MNWSFVFSVIVILLICVVHAIIRYRRYISAGAKLCAPISRTVRFHGRILEEHQSGLRPLYCSEHLIRTGAKNPAHVDKILEPIAPFLFAYELPLEDGTGVTKTYKFMPNRFEYFGEINLSYDSSGTISSISMSIN